MDRRLWNEPIWCGNAKEASKERRQAEKRKVVVKASGLPERELGPLRDQRLHVSANNTIFAVISFG